MPAGGSSSPSPVELFFCGYGRLYHLVTMRKTFLAGAQAGSTASASFWFLSSGVHGGALVAKGHPCIRTFVSFGQKYAPRMICISRHEDVLSSPITCISRHDDVSSFPPPPAGWRTFTPHKGMIGSRTVVLMVRHP